MAFRLCWRLAGAPRRFVGDIAGYPAMIDAQDLGTSLKMFLWRWYEPQVTAVFLAQLNPELPVIDVGANNGYFSLLALRFLQQDVPCVSYEPLPANVENLEASKLLGSHAKWLIRPVGLSNANGEVRFSTPDHASQSGWGRVDGQGRLRICTRTLDAELEQLGIDQLGLVKVDVEGHELAVLEGMVDVLSRRRVHSLMVELHPACLTQKQYQWWLEKLRAFGYQCQWIDERASSANRSSRMLDRGQYRPLAEQLLVPLDTDRLPSDRRYVVWTYSDLSNRALDQDRIEG